MPGSTSLSVAVIGGGPAGLMAAEALAGHGLRVDLYDAMPSVGRKFLLAGKGGMNLTHSERAELFLSRYGARRERVAPWLEAFGPDALRAWVYELGIDTFVGSSGRVFPTDMKAAPLLRAWLHRLRASGVQFHMRHRWLGWGDGVSGDALGDVADGATATLTSTGGAAQGALAASNRDGAKGATAAANMSRLRFATPEGEKLIAADTVVIALGGASWPRLGSDAAWVTTFVQQGVPVQPLLPANCGFDTTWSAHFKDRFAGQPLKSVALSLRDADGREISRAGECLITETGIEGSLVYALSAPIREQWLAQGEANVMLDLLPALPLERVLAEVTRPRGARSLSSHLQSRVGITGVKAGLLHECLSKDAFTDTARVAHALKALPLRLLRPRPIAEAISTAGGVALEALDDSLMLTRMPGVFCAGEMLDWEAPTGGYLLTACLASGRLAGQGALAYLGLTHR
ncbi:TIGR03862 family flavoprotein [Burkholderia sp. L27(2015)]|uniref:TIGR03862 family flavoprotein n=1 Tax=Burkholderia sp. L27(2015) TaxID=1641858 RepID=UPI00131E343B|nr:TIGR03862 family flavoprotein [Burkholderia sp. L27(2015)]